MLVGDFEPGSERRQCAGAVASGETVQSLAVPDTHALRGRTRSRPDVDAGEQRPGRRRIAGPKRRASSQQAAFDARQEPSRFLEKICEPAGLRRDAIRVPALRPLGLGLDEPGQSRPPWPALTFELTTRGARRRDSDGKVALRERDLAEEEPRFSQVERHPALLQRCHAGLYVSTGFR